MYVPVFAGVCVWHSDRMAPHLQHLPVLWPVGPERAAAVGRLAVCGGRHGQLVRQDGVRDISLFGKPITGICPARAIYQRAL